MVRTFPFWLCANNTFLLRIHEIINKILPLGGYRILSQYSLTELLCMLLRCTQAKLWEEQRCMRWCSRLIKQ
jgi:hypothetical protein